MHSRHLAICSWSLQPSDPTSLVLSAQSCDISGVQLALVPLVEDSKWQDPSVIQAAGLKIISGMMATVGEDYSSLASIAQTGGVRPDASWPATWERAKRVADIAASLELSLVTMHAGFLPEGDSKERKVMLTRLLELGDLFQSKGMTLAFETGQESADTLLEVLHELDHSSIGVNFDPANMILYGKGDPVDAMRKLAPWVRQVHIKDAVATAVEGTWGTEVQVGEGDVQWEQFLQAIPDGIALVIEREAGKDRIGDVRKATSLLKEYGAC